MYWVEHADTFSYEYTVVAECATREEADTVRDWYQDRGGEMSEYRVVDRYVALKSIPDPEIIRLASQVRQKNMEWERKRPLRPEEV